MGIDPLDQLWREMLDFDGHAARDPYNQGCWFGGDVRRPLGVTRRPLQLDRLAARGKALADDVVPVQDEARLAEPLFRQHGINRAADEIRERDGFCIFFARRHASWDERFNLYPVLRTAFVPAP